MGSRGANVKDRYVNKIILNNKMIISHGSHGIQTLYFTSLCSLNLPQQVYLVYSQWEGSWQQRRNCVSVRLLCSLSGPTYCGFLFFGCLILSFHNPFISTSVPSTTLHSSTSLVSPFHFSFLLGTCGTTLPHFIALIVEQKGGNGNALHLAVHSSFHVESMIP